MWFRFRKTCDILTAVQAVLGRHVPTEQQSFRSYDKASFRVNSPQECSISRANHIEVYLTPLEMMEIAVLSLLVSLRL